MTYLLDTNVLSAFGHADEHIDDMGLVATAILRGFLLVTRNVDDVRGHGAVVLNPFKDPPELISS